MVFRTGIGVGVVLVAFVGMRIVDGVWSMFSNHTPTDSDHTRFTGTKIAHADVPYEPPPESSSSGCEASGSSC